MSTVELQNKDKKARFAALSGSSTSSSDSETAHDDDENRGLIGNKTQQRMTDAISSGLSQVKDTLTPSQTDGKVEEEPEDEATPQPDSHSQEEKQEQDDQTHRKPKPEALNIPILTTTSDPSQSIASKDDPETPLTPIHRIQTIVDNTVNINHIAFVLRYNGLLIDDKDLHKILDKHQEKKEELIDELCDAYQNQNDQHIPLCKALEATIFNAQRQKFYDIVLKEYISKRELKQRNFVKILKKTIKHLKLSDNYIDLKECERLANGAKLRGAIFYEELDGKFNSEYKSPEEFAKVFASMNVKARIWEEIYEWIKAWKAQNYQKIDYEEIRHILKMYGLMNERETVILKTKLKAHREPIPKKELAPARSLDSPQAQTRVTKRGYENERLLKELCDALDDDVVYEVKQNDPDPDSISVLQSVLVGELKWDNDMKQDKLRAVYDVLLHKYFKNYQLNQRNFLSKLKTTMRSMTEKIDAPPSQAVKDQEEEEEKRQKETEPQLKCVWDEDDIRNVLNIAAQNQLDGKIFVKGLPEYYTPGVKFAKLFKDMQGYKEKNMRRNLARAWAIMNKWDFNYKEWQTKPDHSEFDNGVPLIRNEMKDLPELPKYIHKTIWYQSWDERIESLIDSAVSTLCNMDKLWNDKKFVELIYNDYKFYDAVKRVSDDMAHLGENKGFFEAFVEDNYKREMEVWRIELEQANPLTDKKQALQRIMGISFNEFDFNQDDKITRIEFNQCILANRIKLERNYVDELFDTIDVDHDDHIVLKELAEFIQETKKKLEEDEDTKVEHNDEYDGDFIGEWDREANEYVIDANPNYNHEANDTFKWFCYIPQIPEAKRTVFEEKHPGEKIRGYWKDVDDDNEDDDDFEHLPWMHLNQIFFVLNHYYNDVGENDKSPLHYKNRDPGTNIMTECRFVIEQKSAEVADETERCRYELTWWNQRGWGQPNAIAVERILRDGEEPPNPRVSYYMRLNTKRTELEWKWYDVNNSEYKTMGQYTEGTNEKKLDHSLIGQLEASFLANDHKQFDPSKLGDDVDLFNSCWLPKLKTFLKARGVRAANMFVFSVTFTDNTKTGRQPVSIEQIGYTHSEGSAYPRNIARFINGNDSLLQISGTQDSFVQRWMALFKLYTEEQQMYFWSFVLAIATQIKYIDIEFKNQLVLWPLKPDGGNHNPQSIISELIDYNDVEREYRNAMNFDGYLVPPLVEWQEIADNKNTQNQISKTHPLRRAKPEGVNDPSESEYRWLLEETDRDYQPFHFDKDETVILRMVDVIRKFMLEFELKHKMKAVLWPWFQNSKYSNNDENAKLYNGLMKKFNLIHEFDNVVPMYHKDRTEEWTQSNKEEHNIFRCCSCLKKDGEDAEETDEKNKDETDEMNTEGTNSDEKKAEQTQCIRHKRKFAAIQLLANQTGRDLNYLRHYFNVSQDEWMKEANVKNKIDKIEKEHCKHHTKRSIGDETDILECVAFYILNMKKKRSVAGEDHTLYWKETKPRRTIEPTPEDLEPVTFHKYAFPFFEEFMMNCFVEPDKKTFKRNMSLKENETHWQFYRIFIDSWRNVPTFWEYKHDILLLELVLRHGIDCDAIVKDIDTHSTQYKDRFPLYAVNTLSTTKHPLYAFQIWCKAKTNLLHRLQYVIKTIMYSLNNSGEWTKDPDKQRIFSSYQRQSHLDFVQYEKNHEWTFTENDNDGKENQNDRKQNEMEEKELNLSFKLNIDRYIPRDIKTELFESLQAFDLKKYGPVITQFIIQKLKREPKESHVFVLGQLLYSLPDPKVIEILWDSKDALQRAKPEKLKELCLQIQAGSLFKPSTCLSIAEFFGKLADTDLVQAETWEKYETDFENMAFEDVAKIEHNHMLFILLNTPLANHEGRCLIQLAQEGQRVSFLNNERISDVINHMYRRGHLKIDEPLKPKTKTFAGMLYTLSRYPFRFYLSPQGYHWIAGVLYVEYLLLLFAYAYWWPLRSNADVECRVCLDVLEVVFWLSNLGYILFEVHEFSEKKLRQYFNLAMMGDANVMDAMVSLTWVVLFAIRIGLGVHEDYRIENDNAEVSDGMIALEKIYTFVFGIAILLITMRSLKILSNSQYFGALILIIKSMFKEMMKFVFIYVLMMFAVLFALRFMSEELKHESMWYELLDIYELFIGSGSIGSGSDFNLAFDAWTKIYLVIATVIGTLLLFNLLIALMVSKYESAQEQADKDVMLNRTETAFDLLRRSRHMPPPLNIVMYVFTIVVWCLNFIVSVVSVCTGAKWNMFKHIHYDLFHKMRTLNIWKSPWFWLGLTIATAIELVAPVKWWVYCPNLKSVMIFASICTFIFFVALVYTCWEWCYRSHTPYDYLSNYNRERGKLETIRSNHTKERDDKPKKEDKAKNELEYFKSLTLVRLLRWYWIELSSALFLMFDFILLLVNAFGIVDIILSSRTSGSGWHYHDRSLRMLHKGCYGRITRFAEFEEGSGTVKLNPIDGISMSKYLDKHQQENKHSIARSDKIMLNKLTAQTLFCPHCYQPFLNTEDEIEKQLVSSHNALFDLMSAVTFVVVPIAWIPLLIIMFLGVVMDTILKLFDVSDRVNENYSNKDYDRNYFPNKIMFDSQ